MATRLCQREACGRPHRARGLCSTHYNQEHVPNRHRVVQMPCAWCSHPILKASSRRWHERFCGYECRDDMRAYRIRPDHPRLLQPLRCRELAIRTPDFFTVPTPPPRPRLFTAGPCARCGASFVAFDPSRTANVCSARCGKGLGRDRRRARKRDAYVEDVWRERIYRRDGYRCQLCRRKVRRDVAVPHPLAPTLDHIIPLAAGVEAGGVHAPHNVQCAHYMCNCTKQANMITVQLALFG